MGNFDELFADAFDNSLRGGALLINLQQILQESARTQPTRNDGFMRLLKNYYCICMSYT